jgi:L-alanine-DL-glutamate epimerase-like enolase superfamily enzyme
VTGTTLAARKAAQDATKSGFDQLKIKIGATDVDQDIERVLAVAQVAPNSALLLDANCGYTVREALAFLKGVGRTKERILVFEQPTPRDDFSALGEIQRKGGVPVAADESLRGREDLARLLREGDIDAVNIKTAKFGLFEGADLLIAAKIAGFSLMIGGMVETELSMSASACLAAGIGGVRFIDLDTPLFMKERPLSGGYTQRGPHLDLSSVDLGHGVGPTDRK